ncbi:MAG: tRNA (guanosine(37)-N1)-methyltransferase TrmD [Candidatus Vogelbacteria bacterium]|nr:tRNA (guanosine(37)-N1)-methyltransferase TrmD [Candidatus Vogelbacteria bacterium]
MLTFHIITLFPESLASYLRASIVARAIKNKKIRIKTYNPYDFLPVKERADARPYGGGPGMVLRPEPILKAVAAIKLKAKSSKLKAILFSPSGKQFTNQIAVTWAKKYRDIILIAGRYEGVDTRVGKILKAEAVSVGPYVLTGGELPALVVIDTTARQIPGVLGKNESVEERRVASAEIYTRPEILKYKGKNYKVPKVLLSGHHRKIDHWRRNKQK